MTQTAAVYTTELDSALAGKDLAAQVLRMFGDPPDAVVLFASARFDQSALLGTFTEACHPKVLVGSSSAGEFTGDQRGVSSACALAIRSRDMQFSVGIGVGVSSDPAAAAAAVTSTFRGVGCSDFPYRTALVLTDALAGHADELIEHLTLATAGGYEFAGGGAGDDAKFSRTEVFAGTRVETDAVVALEILSKKPVGVGVQHGWQPASESLEVTEAIGAKVVSIDGFPAVEAFEHHARDTGQEIDRAAPLPFFLHNILGIDTSAGYRLRVPLAIDDDGSITCAAEIPTGSRVRIMRTSASSAAEAASTAARNAVRSMGEQPAASLFFDCVATRLRLGDVFGLELDAVKAALGGGNLVGCNTYGQIARAAGQFGGFHNCTAVVLAFPQ